MKNTSHNRALACGVSLSNAAQRIHQFANCHRARPAAAVRYRTHVRYRTAAGKLIPSHSAHTSRETGFVVVATVAYRALETETTVQ